MKRSRLKRTVLKRKTHIGHCQKQMRQTKLKPVGKRKRRTIADEKAFTAAVRERCKVSDSSEGRDLDLFQCERCPAVSTRRAFSAHHMCPKSRGVGHEWLNDAGRNGAGLCAQCHIEELHGGTPSDRGDWIKTRNWLEAGGKLG